MKEGVYRVALTLAVLAALALGALGFQARRREAPGLLNTPLFRARAHLKAGRLREAQREYLMYARLFPEDREARRALSTLEAALLGAPVELP